MAQLNTTFDTFLTNIEPDKDAKEYAQDAHTPVRKFLENDEEFKQYFQNSFLYGSYARHTTIGDIKDIDIVVVTKFSSTNTEHTPKIVLGKLKRALNRYYKDGGNTEYGRKSIKVKDPLPDNPDVEITLDVIPAIPVNGEDNPLLVPDREDGEWIFTHPKGHIAYISELNDENHWDGMFVPLVKMVRYWWILKSKKKHPKPKGFWVECLVAENFNGNNSSHADNFINVLNNISQKYQYYETYTEPPPNFGQLVSQNS